MFIKSLKLENFQKHEKFECKFTEKVNVICGESDIGKSCLIRAIRWVLFNDIRGDVVRKFGTDKTIVEVELNSGVIVRKIKSNKENAYEVQFANEVKRYDAIGKGIPEDVKNIIGIIPMIVDKEQIILNVSQQISMPFLLCDKATFRMKVFNRLTGNDVLDAVNQGINKDSLNLNKEIKRYEQEHDTGIQELQRIEKLFLEGNQRLLQSKEIFKRISEKSDAISKVKLCIESFKTISESIVNCKYDIGKFKIPEGLDVLKIHIEKYEKINDLILSHADIEERIFNNKKALSEIKDVKINIDRQQIEKYESVKLLIVVLNKVEVSASTCKTNINSVQHEISTLNKKHKELLRNVKVCPVCKRDMSEDVIEGIVK